MTTRIEFKIDIDEDFSDERESPENKYLDKLAKIKAQLEATIDSWGYLIERSRLNIYEVSGTFLDKTMTEDGDFIINASPLPEQCIDEAEKPDGEGT